MGTEGVQAQVEYSVGALANVSHAKKNRGGWWEKVTEG